MAVACDDFLYVHIPKTGGSFVEAALQRLLEHRPATFIDTSRPQDRGRFGCRDQHDRLEQIPEPWRSKPLLATVRNPFDHHVSLYEYGWWKRHEHDTFEPGRVRQRYPHFPELDFREYLDAVNDWSLVDESLAPSGGFTRLQTAGIGLLTLEYIRYLCPDPEVVLAELPGLLAHGELLERFAKGTWVPTHALNSQLHRFLLSLGYPAEDVDFILDMARVLPEGSTRTAAMGWRDYYDADSLCLVRERERVLFELFPGFEK